MGLKDSARLRKARSRASFSFYETASEGAPKRSDGGPAFQPQVGSKRIRRPERAVETEGP
jgi:hypothetical protein